MPITPLVAAVRSHLDTNVGRLRCFHQHERQFEKWLQAEMLYVLDSQRDELGIDRLRIEVSEADGKFDLVAHLKDQTRLWIELKHWHIGLQAGVRWRAEDCLRPKDAFGLTKDVARLTHPERLGRGYAMLLFTANPGVEDWNRGLTAFNAHAAPNVVHALTEPAEFPSEYFLGVLTTRRAS